MFLDPLNMSDSVPSQDVLSAASENPELFEKEKLNRYKRTLARYAQPYRLYGDEIVHTTYPWGGISTAAGLLSTAPDLAKLDVAIDLHVYLKEETQEQSWTPFVSNSGRPLVHGLGWFVQSYHGLKCVWHFGNDPDEFSGTYLKLPEKGMSLILLANSDALSKPFYRTGILSSSPFLASFLPHQGDPVLSWGVLTGSGRINSAVGLHLVQPGIIQWHLPKRFSLSANR